MIIIVNISKAIVKIRCDYMNKSLGKVPVVVIVVIIVVVCSTTLCYALLVLIMSNHNG